MTERQNLYAQMSIMVLGLGLKEAGEGINLFEEGVIETGILRGMPKDKHLRLLISIGMILPFGFLILSAFILIYYHNTFNILYFTILGSIFGILCYIFVAIPIFISIPLDDQKVLGLKRDRISFSIGAILLFIAIPTMFITFLLYLSVLITGILLLFIPLFLIIPRIKKKNN